jgi:hypothetical protein
MKSVYKWSFGVALGAVLFVGFANSATASGSAGGGGSSAGGGGSSAGGSSAGGGGGGGGIGGGINRHGGNFNLIFDQAGPNVGSRSNCVGGYHYTTYVTTLAVDWECRNLDESDGQVLVTTVYSKDFFTGMPWAPMVCGTTTVLGGRAAFSNTNVITTGINGLPVIMNVVVSRPDGTPIWNGHP